MRKSTSKIIVLLFVLLISIFILLFLLSWKKEPSTPSVEVTESEISISQDTSSEENIAEIIAPPSKKPATYLERCALDYVDVPVKRTRAEALERIKELSRYFPALYQVYLYEENYHLEILLSVANNPEMTDYAYGFLTTDGSVTGGITEEETPDTYPLFLQWDIRWGYMPYGSQGTIGSSGCGPSCLSMAVYYLTGNPKCTPDAVAKYSLEHGHYIEGIGTAWALLDNYPREYGLQVSHPSVSEKNIKQHLDQGNILICSVRPGDFTAEGHFIVIYGYDENGFKVNDPKCIYRSRLSWSYEQIQDDIKRIWSVGK